VDEDHVQQRLRGLLRANQLITGRLSLADVLRGIVEAAQELVGARYTALGVIAPDGGLAEFIHRGMPADMVARIGHLPQGKGLLGAVIAERRPIRLRRIADDARSSGFPPGHPPMESFLGVPIQIRDESFGNLYLAESTRGAFTAEDEELVTALAATAAAAIENARLYEAARSRGEWMQASAAIMRRLLSVPEHGEAGDDPLRLIAEYSREIADADVVTVVRPPPAGGSLRVEIAVGDAADRVRGLRAAREGSLEGQVLTTGEALRLTHPGRTGLRAVTLGDLGAGPVMVVPLIGSRGVRGVLTVARAPGRQAFAPEDLEMAAGFAHQGAVAVELAEARSDQQRAAMLDERERIAADLHDHVIQRLFAAGLSLQGVAAMLGPGPATDRVQATVDDLDTTIRQIRTTIFQLQQPAPGKRAGARARLLDVAAEAVQGLGFDPAVRFSGVLDVLPAALTDDLEAVLREALSNVARHAAARAVEVEVSSKDGRVTLAVRDDGTGPGENTRRSGLANLARRAEQHGGTCALEASAPWGTQLTWSVPLA
jgi:signal transduction histidine kinase